MRTRSLLRYLPLYLTLLVPLAALAWIGSGDLQRLEERAISQLRNEAVGFVEERMRKVEQDLQQQAQVWLNDELGDALVREEGVVDALRGLTHRPQILEVFVCDEEFQMLAPLQALVREPSLPLSRFPSDFDSEDHLLARADLLCSLGDPSGAEQTYIDYTRQRDMLRRRDFGLCWAHFHLAGLQDQLAKQGDAETNYIYARLYAEELYRQDPDADLAAIMLLSDMRQAQLLLDEASLLGLLEDLSRGRQQPLPYLPHVADDLISWTIEEICASLPRSRMYTDAALTAREADRLRSSGRRFAKDYADLAQLELFNAVRSGFKTPKRDILYHVLTTENSTTLLAMRRALPAEGDQYPDAAWVGLRLDLAGMVVSSLSGNTRSQAGNVALLVRDKSDIPLLEPGEVLTAPILERVQIAPLTSFLDLEFQAIPLADATEIRASERNKTLMVLILILTAGSGGFLLIRAMRREADLARTKVQLVSRVTHELKTPLAVIKMYGETLGMGRTRDQTQVGQFAGIISHEADRLTTMVDRILDFSRMEQGTYEYERKELDLSRLVEQVCEEYEAHVLAQGTELDWDVEPGLRVCADAEASSGALINLLENAVKYGAEVTGERSVEVHLRRSGDTAQLSVMDRGPGIPEDDLDRVFEEFYRAKNAGEVRGAGIGLSLVQHYAQAHEGQVKAARRDGGGTTITIHLPLQDPETARNNRIHS